MKKSLLLWGIILLVQAASLAQSSSSSLVKLSKQVLADKIKGGWAGQTIGVTFGGPYEFQYNGTFIQDYQPLTAWGPEKIKHQMLNNAGLYDDIYMDLTFVDVFEKYGLDAPVDSFANAYARAGYMLWHANQAGRYNILTAVKAPASGQWKNNPHADDIDFQIEADFAGLMSPGLPQTAAAISDKIGHIMNYGDGWYGGVYVATLYSLAFTYSDVKRLVRDALVAIPKESSFYQCISDVIRWHGQYPNDWHQAWYEIQKKWSSETGCPDGVFAAFNIDAKVNAAYVVLGLLYGNGDFGKTLEVATRAGQDADCNPSTAGGILATMLGYSGIPLYWKQGVEEAGDIDFKYTTMSLNKTYKVSLQQALANIERAGGKQEGDFVFIPVQRIKTVPLEQSFPNLIPVAKIPIHQDLTTEYRTRFTGSGIVVRGEAQSEDKALVLIANVYIDDVEVESVALPVSFTLRRHDIFWKYDLPPGEHELRIKMIGPAGGAKVRVWDMIVYKNDEMRKK